MVSPPTGRGLGPAGPTPPPPAPSPPRSALPPGGGPPGGGGRGPAGPTGPGTSGPGPRIAARRGQTRARGGHRPRWRTAGRPRPDRSRGRPGRGTAAPRIGREARSSPGALPVAPPGAPVHRAPPSGRSSMSDGTAPCGAPVRRRPVRSAPVTPMVEDGPGASGPPAVRREGTVCDNRAPALRPSP